MTYASLVKAAARVIALRRSTGATDMAEWASALDDLEVAVERWREDGRRRVARFRARKAVAHA